MRTVRQKQDAVSFHSDQCYKKSEADIKVRSTGWKISYRGSFANWI